MPVTLIIEASTLPALLNNQSLQIGFGIDNKNGSRVLTRVSDWSGYEIRSKSEHFRIICELEKLPLVPGEYYISASIAHSGEALDYVEHCAVIRISNSRQQALDPRNLSHGPLEIENHFKYIPSR